MTNVSDPASLLLRPFGRTGLQVSSICLGCAPLSSMPDAFYPVPEEQALDLLRTTFKSPIHFLDTSASRFGLAYTDFTTQQRIIKDSGHWYGRVVHANALVE